MAIKLIRGVIYIFSAIGLLFVIVYISMQLGLTNEKGVVDNQQRSFIERQSMSYSSPAWTRGEEWSVLKTAIIKDAAIIKKAATDAGIDPRLIVSVLVPEQLRLFHDERELFKKIFAPLQILVNQNQFSWGIMGIKRETAMSIEEHLKLPDSPFYLGSDFENSLDFSSNEIGNERFIRLKDEENHYFGYFYAALFIRQIVNQWETEGMSISDRPEIIATLYNIGFDNSHPNASPQSGGSSIELNRTVYSFGSLAAEFYYSDELIEQFPRVK